MRQANGNKKILAIIPARGGSKGILRKNILPLHGRPLIAWTIDAACSSKYIDRCIVSTDDIEIASIAKKFGAEVPYLRNPELALDTSSSADVVLDVLSRIDGDYESVLLLQPTSPLRSTKDIDGIIKLSQKKGYPSIVSICKVSEHPAWMYKVDSNFKLESFCEPMQVKTRRQDLEPVYTLNGAMYLVNVKWFTKNRLFVNEQSYGYEMPDNRSIDIDVMSDFERVEFILQNSKSKVNEKKI